VWLLANERLAPPPDCHGGITSALITALRHQPVFPHWGAVRAHDSSAVTTRHQNTTTHTLSFFSFLSFLLFLSCQQRNPSQTAKPPPDPLTSPNSTTHTHQSSYRQQSRHPRSLSSPFCSSCPSWRPSASASPPAAPNGSCHGPAAYSSPRLVERGTLLRIAHAPQSQQPAQTVERRLEQRRSPYVSVGLPSWPIGLLAAFHSVPTASSQLSVHRAAPTPQTLTWKSLPLDPCTTLLNRLLPD
jgi:hypothetical protein